MSESSLSLGPVVLTMVAGGDGVREAAKTFFTQSVMLRTRQSLQP